MSHPAVSVIHFGSAVAAIAAGAIIVCRPKGSRQHRRIGLSYVCAMVALNVSSFFIYSLTGSASPFHVMAIFSLVTVLAGYGAAVLRRPQGGWMEWHLQFMVWSYIGLLAAAAAEAAVRLPRFPFWGSVAAASIAVLAAGGILFARRLPTLRSRYAPFARGRRA